VEKEGKKQVLGELKFFKGKKAANHPFSVHPDRISERYQRRSGRSGGTRDCDSSEGIDICM